MAGITVGRKLIAAAVASVALAASGGAAFASETGGTTNWAGSAGRGSMQVALTQAAKTQKGPDIPAIAHDLGISVDKLNKALIATKEWLGTQTKPTEQAFAGHLASLLGLPSAKVLKALVAHGLIINSGPGDKGGKGGGKPVDLTKVAHDLGVSVAQLENAFVQTKIWIGTSGTKPTPEAFAAHVAGILGKPAAFVLQVLERDGIIVKDQQPGPKTSA